MLDLSDVCIAADAMVGGQTYLNEAGMHGSIGGVDCGEAIIDPDIVHDHAEIFGSDLLPDDLFRLGKLLLSDVELGSRRSFDVDDELACVGLREVGEAEKCIQR